MEAAGATPNGWEGMAKVDAAGAAQVQQEAAWAVLNLSVSPANEPALIASGVLEPIAALLRVGAHILR